jgi:hypothetical protein
MRFPTVGVAPTKNSAAPLLRLSQSLVCTRDACPDAYQSNFNCLPVGVLGRAAGYPRLAAPSVHPLLVLLLPAAPSRAAQTYPLSTPPVLPEVCPVPDIIAAPLCQPQTCRPSVVDLLLGSREQERSVHLRRGLPAAQPHAHRLMNILPALAASSH